MRHLLLLLTLAASLLGCGARSALRSPEDGMQCSNERYITHTDLPVLLSTRAPSWAAGHIHWSVIAGPGSAADYQLVPDGAFGAYFVTTKAGRYSIRASTPDLDTGLYPDAATPDDGGPQPGFDDAGQSDRHSCVIPVVVSGDPADCEVGAMRPCYDGPPGTDGVGTCRAGTQTCVSGQGSVPAVWDVCENEVLPTEETCDGDDHLCNGRPADGCACIRNTTRMCYSGPAGTAGVGACRAGTNRCTQMGATPRDVGWTTGCDGEVDPQPAEICDNSIDDNCNGMVDERCHGVIVCPGAQAVDAGQPVTLSVAGMGLTNITWTITSAPDGGLSSAVWSPASQNAEVETFTPFIVGVYTIEIRATDPTGLPARCTFTVSANSHGLRVELTWDGTGDVDLHLHDQTDTPWYGAQDDCFYAFLGTPWGAMLDIDNTTSNGPENIRIDTPTIGATYTIGVHNYSRAQGRTATVNVFCGSTNGTMPTQTFVSRQLSGSDTGNCTSNDFWRVATVTFQTTQACTITPLNTYTPSSDACDHR